MCEGRGIRKAILLRVGKETIPWRGHFKLRLEKFKLRPEKEEAMG